MAFGQKRPGRPRGRPPKDPQARALYDEEYGVGREYSAPSKASGADTFDAAAADSVLDPALALQTVEDMQSVLHDMRARYEKSIDERVRQAVRERDVIQEQFDRLKELRVTQSEKTLVEWKRASEARQRRTLLFSPQTCWTL